ncbi:type II secretion system protein [Candidatus Dojkabacteria bacterium]|nr:type II secretion system protein [Candidatus Dojkabacteria bacterium]
MLKRFSRKNGFTLIEILLVISLMGIIFIIITGVDRSAIIRNDLIVASDMVASSIRRAQSLSQAMQQDSQWGVRIVNNQIIVFKGDSYDTRDSIYDDVYEVPSSISISGLDEIIFAKLTGDPDITGSIVLNTSINQSNTISINEKGIVDY